MADADAKQVLALKTAIQQRDSLLRMVEGEKGASWAEIDDDVQAPLPDRLLALEAQLRVKDELLERAGRVADNLVEAPSAAEAERQREQREQREDVQADWQRVSSMILPQRVSRPSWLASADPKAGGDRLKQRLQLADARYEHMYFEQRKIQQQQQQQQQQHAGWSLNVGTLSVKDMAFTQVGGEEEEGGGAGVRGLRPDQGAGATKEPPKHLTRKTWHVMSFNQAAPLQQRVSPMRGVPVEPEIQTQSPIKPPSEDEQTLCTDAEGGEPEVAHCEREVSPPLRSPPPAREQERVRQLVETLLVAPRARALAAAAASNAHMSHAPASSLRSLPANERMVEGEERQLINEVNAILDQAPALASATAGTAGGSEVMERLVAHIVRREEQLLEALRLSAASDQRVRAAESELERVRGDNTSLSGQAARLSAVENELSSRLAFAHQELAQEKAKRLPPDPSLLYARDDHLRAMEELEDARAQLTAAKAALSESEREMEAREEQLVVATDNLAAVQQDRTRLQQDLVALGAQLGEAETRLKDSQLEHHELALSSRAEIDQVTSSLHELQTRFQDEVGHMVEKEARLALEQKELVEAQAALHTQVQAREQESLQQMGDAVIKMESQEEELVVLRARVKDLEVLLVEQQDTLDRLIADAMGEVAKREEEWASVRERNEARIAKLEDSLARVRMDEQLQRERADEYQRQFRAMEDDYRERLTELQARFERTQAALTRDIDLQKRDFRRQFEVAEERSKQAQERDARQQKQITELLQQKAWMQRQMGLPEIVS